MTGNVSQHDMRVQRAIEADAKMREIAKKSVHWPDPDKPRGERKPLKPIHVGHHFTEHGLAAAAGLDDDAQKRG